MAGASLALLIAAPAAAQRSADWDRCMNPSNAVAPGLAVAACTAVIESFPRGEIARPDAAAAHLRRGNAYAANGERNLATADYDGAIAHYDRII
jgi:hypothetical protein